VRRAVVNLRDARPAWRIPAWAEARIAAAFGPGWTVHVVESAADGRGDGGAVADEAVRKAAGAEVYIGFGLPRAILEAAPGLRWVHTGTAGVAGLLHDEVVASDLVVTNSAGVHAPPIAETVIGMVLHFARGLDFAVRAQHEARWDPGPYETRVGLVREVAAGTLGILGVGGIGRAVAARARALGMRVLGVRRSARAAPDGIELLTGDDALERLFAAADWIVVTAPSTPATRGMVTAGLIEAMRRDAVLINVSRGDLIDEMALVRALRDGQIRGAALDVTQREPLPPDSPLWTLPNVLITPHVSAVSPGFWDRETALILENIRRYLDGRPLRNVVDKTAGY
jgi:phosphoglycerate dehydrogenase-like enzyme